MGKKIKGQYMNRSTFWMIKYMNGSVFSKARYMNGVGFEILARTPVPKLPLSYPPHPRGLILSTKGILTENRRPHIRQKQLSCMCSPSWRGLLHGACGGENC